jgi:hypothetical protein
MTTPNWPPMVADRVINGAYGSLQEGNDYLAQVRNIQARISINRQDLVPVGDAFTRYKKMSYTGDGSFTLWKATSHFLKIMVDAVSANGKVPTTLLTVTLKDPESLGKETVTLHRVKLWEVPIGFNSGELLEETIQFTFEGITMDSEITGDVRT